MNENTHILYFSPTETTEKIAREIGSVFSKQVIEHDITDKTKREKNLVFQKEDCLIVGVPVYSGRIPKVVKPFFEALKGNETPAICFVMYGNRAYEDALLELQTVLKENGFQVIGAGSFVGEHTYTPLVATQRPDSKDLEVAREFAKKWKNKLEEGIITPITVPGNSAYRPYSSSSPMEIETKQSCISCGICAQNCPTGAIAVDDFSKVDGELCINCLRCVKKCPIHAKWVNSQRLEQIQNWLIENFSKERKEPENFL